MNPDLEKIAQYERITPSCMQEMAKALPGLDAIIRDDLLLISSSTYPDPDVNRAYLLRTTPEKIDQLIDEIVDHFKSKEMPTTIMVSPACTPTDLPKRLLTRGFVKQEPDESWLVYEHLQAAIAPPTDPKIVVKPVEKTEVEAFAKVITVAYGMSPEWTPMLTQILEPTIGLPNMTHYLAYINKKPLATLTIMRYQSYAVVGSAGVLPEHRGSNIIYNVTVNALLQARQEGVDTAVLQTTLGPLFERFLRICGFKLAFRRAGYKLE